MKETPLQNRAASEAALGRLTALWALSEAALGGALHALRLPVAGILVGGSAVLLITTIAHVARQRGQSPASAIARATAVVLAVKAAASPHSPPGAYVAVSFQGAVGAALFSVFSGRVRGPALALGAAATGGAAVQKLLMLFFFFGVPLFESVDALGQRVAAMAGMAPGADFSLSLWLAAGYVGTHLAAGLAIGAFAGRLPGRAEKEWRRLRAANGRPAGPEAARPSPEKATKKNARRRRWAWGAFLAGVALVYAFVGEAGGGSALRVLFVVLRALGALALWQVLLRPLLATAARRFFPHGRYATDVREATGQFPALRRLAVQSWRELRKHEPGAWQRVTRFAPLLVARALLLPEDAPAGEAPPSASAGASGSTPRKKGAANANAGS